MSRRLPLTALWVFEAVARHQNLTAAAAELHLTHAAVSRHIRELEAYFERPLCERLARGVRISAEGLRLAQACSDGFARVYAGVETMRLAGRRVLTLTTVPSLAALWLIPRLQRFQERFPELEWRLDTSTRRVDFAREDVDIGIRFGPGHWPGLFSRQLFRPGEFAVCAPTLRDGSKPIRQLQDLLQHQLLHDDSTRNWSAYFAKAGLHGDPPRGLVFSDRNVLMQAAVTGQGVALASAPIAWADLNAGRLVRLFDITVEPDWSYFVVCRKDRAKEPMLAAMSEWLVQEAQATSAELLPEL